MIAAITGVTGMRIIRAIVASERDPDELTAMRDVRREESIETIRAALVGNYQPEHVFALKQALAGYDFYQNCIDERDTGIERTVVGLNIERPVPEAPPPKAKHRNKPPNDPSRKSNTIDWPKQTLAAISDSLGVSYTSALYIVQRFGLGAS